MICENEIDKQQIKQQKQERCDYLTRKHVIVNSYVEFDRVIAGYTYKWWQCDSFRFYYWLARLIGSAKALCIAKLCKVIVHDLLFFIII